jgi:hypothetical protein
MKADLRFDFASFLPPVSFFAVITAFLYPFVNFPLKLPVLFLLFFINGALVLFSGYLKKKRGFEGSHNWIREFIIFQIVFSVLWLFAAGYLIPFGKEPPRPEYVVFYFLVFPTQWLLTLKLRNNMPPEKILSPDIQEIIKALRGNRTILLVLQFSLAMLFMLGFRMASDLPLVIQMVYWLNLAINFVLIIFTNRQLEEMSWIGHGIKDKPVVFWYRLPLIMFLMIAALSLFSAWKLPVFSLHPFFDLVLVLIRWLAQRLIKPDPETIIPENSEPVDLSRSVSDIMKDQDGSGTSLVAGIGDIIIRLSILILLAAFVLSPFIKFLLLSQKKRSAMIRQILKDFRETMKLIFTRKPKLSVINEGSVSHYTKREHGLGRKTRNLNPRKGSIEILFAEICHWGGIKGFPYEQTTPPLEYIEKLAVNIPEKGKLLVEAGFAINRYMYDKYPVLRSEWAETKKTVKRIIK